VRRRIYAAALKRGFGVAVAVACMGPATSFAQSTSEKAIKTRQSAYYLMSQQMARINATLKGEGAFDWASLVESADAVELIGRIVVHYYPPGSDQGDTKARPDIWKEAPRFRQLSEDLQAESTKLKVAINGGDLALIKAAYGATSKSCKACHDVYKER